MYVKLREKKAIEIEYAYSYFSKLVAKPLVSFKSIQK